MRTARVLEYTTKLAHLLDSARSAGRILTSTQVLEPTPRTARRVRHDRPGAVVRLGVALDVPRVNVGQTEIATVGLNVQRSNGHGPNPIASLSAFSRTSTRRPRRTTPGSF